MRDTFRTIYPNKSPLRRPMIRFRACLIRTKLVSTRLQRKLKLMFRAELATSLRMDDSVGKPYSTAQSGTLTFIIYCFYSYKIRCLTLPESGRVGISRSRTAT